MSVITQAKALTTGTPKNSPLFFLSLLFEAEWLPIGNHIKES
jgi:hypothetical protein